MMRTGQLALPIKVFDFFSGCGGTCIGFHQAGLEIAFALDTAEDARRTFKSYRAFRDLEPIPTPIEEFDPASLHSRERASQGNPLLFSGCAPCQPFTKQNTTRRENDARLPLLLRFLAFVKKHVPEYVFVENVPGIQNLSEEEGPLCKFLETLDDLDYEWDCGVVAAQDYGIPQQRHRFVLAASRLGPIALPIPTHGPRSPRKARYRTVKDAIGELPAIAAGEEHFEDPLHHAANLSELNLERIRFLKEGQGREHWPRHLWLQCHSNGYRGHTDVYGRMSWDHPSSGLTTRCNSLSNGRFGHPEQDRAISLREAALLQTFPWRLEFHGSMRSIARQIGNAVPPRLAKVFGRHFVKHFKEHCGDG